MKNVKIKYEVPTELWVGRHLVCSKCGSEGDLEETDDVTFNPIGVTLSAPMYFHFDLLARCPNSICKHKQHLGTIAYTPSATRNLP